MTPTAWLFLGLAVAAMAAAGWLAAARARVAMELAQARREGEARAAELERIIARAAAAEAEAQRLGVEGARMAERIRADEQRYAEREATMREQHEANIEAMQERFRAAAGDALSASQKDFLALAREAFKAERADAAREMDQRREAVDKLIAPIGESLKKADEKLGTIERTWTSDRAGLAEQLRGLTQASAELRTETGRLAGALRDPNIRGRYGEIQLRRVVELAGMTAYCDFTEQGEAVDSEGRPLRPDMVVRLPGERCIVVDAKTNLKSYLDAMNAPSPREAEEHLGTFASAVAKQAGDLAKKRYYQGFDGSPEFVVMFIPGDGFLDAALARQPELLDLAARQGVILTSPATLIGLLRAVALALQEQRIAEQARELRELGKELHERACTVFEHMERLGGSLGQAVERYNKAMGSVELRLIPTLRKFEEGGAGSGKTIPELPDITAMPSRTPVAGSQPD